VRSEYSHALEYAILCANHLQASLVVLFVLCDAYPEANERSYAFMLEGERPLEGVPVVGCGRLTITVSPGLVEVKGLLARRGIQLIVRSVRGTTHSSLHTSLLRMCKNLTLWQAVR
jgi:hypothetical protein